jgi:hypothetical protein
VDWKGAVNRGLLRAGDRLVQAPAFVLCTVRSGSTLLRVLLDSHTDIHAPHELHLRDLDVVLRKGYPEVALDEVGLDAQRLRFLLWDRVLHRELAASGKRRFVNKTPSDVFIADDIAACWPDARFIFLLRHPGAIARSRQETRPQDSAQRNAEMVRAYGDALERARQSHAGLTLRYEDLAADPQRSTRVVCDFLGVPWQPQMLEYGRFDHGRLAAGLGDWKEKIRSGHVQPPAPAPQDVPAQLRHLCEAWGYAADAEPAAADALR